MKEIVRLLIANHGMSATKFCHSFREWRTNTGPDETIVLVGIVTPMDILANYEYISLVDETVATQHTDVYTSMDRMMELIDETRPTMVWPGWGYFSEWPEFARALDDRSIVFLGPNENALRRLGDKMECVALSKELGIPNLPWSGPEPIVGLDMVMHHAEQIGYPVMVKASQGGGGRGIRPALSAESIVSVYNQVREEVPGPIFVCKLARNCRHIEVQFVGDGVDAMHLYTRDCSVQRRNQKLVEEGPAPNIPHSVISEMQTHTARLAQHVGYRGVGTAEFLFEPSSQSYYFLEINPRLQVEHVVTEMLFDDMNLPVVQYCLARGMRFDEIPYICTAKRWIEKYPTPPWCCVAARIVSENPEDSFQPSSGTIEQVVDGCTGGAGTWSYWSVRKGEILSNADGQFGHVFSRGRTRKTAIGKLIEYLHSLRITGTVFHTAGFLKAVVDTDTFRRVLHHTQWVEKWAAKMSQQDNDMVFYAVAVYSEWEEQRRTELRFDALSKKGHPIPGSVCTRHTRTLSWAGKTMEVTTVSVPRHDRVWIVAEGRHYGVRCLACKNGVFNIYTKSRVIQIRRFDKSSLGSRYRIGTRTYWFPELVEASRVVAPVTGKLLCWTNASPDVASGDVIAHMEAMKMVIEIKALKSGILARRVLGSSKVVAGDNLGSVTTEDDADDQGADDQGAKAHPRHETMEWDAVEWETAGVPGLDKLVERFVGSYRQPVHFNRGKGAKSTPIKRTQSFLHNGQMKAQSLGTTYILDWPRRFCSEEARVKQLVLHRGGEVAAKAWDRARLSSQKMGMMAWEIECGNVSIVLLVNDVTWKGGAFGPDESEFYVAISRYARRAKLPRIHVSANAGAMMRPCVQVVEKIKGQYGGPNGSVLQYLYMDEEDYLSVQDHVVVTKVGERYRIDSVVGDRGCGVENLHMSGEMAREMVLARESGFVLTYVTARSVGIGAYLAKLGERIIQHRDSSILLTGYRALNELLGADLYSGNHELGGPGIMEGNGITHIVVPSDAVAAVEIMRWVRLATQKRPTQPATDAAPESDIPMNRPLVTPLPKENFQVRDMIESMVDGGSWQEVLADWGKSVVCGRGRIGGYSVGVVATQCCVTETVRPADPGNPDSVEERLIRAGRVWFPDSSAKTARVLEDFRLEGIPTVILANWRGFSGGTRDMHDEILKFGSEIVNTLVRDGPPVYCFVPRNCQLRGGAMVVVSQGVNPERIVIVADPTSSMGILEPEAAAPILWKHAADEADTMGVEFARTLDTPERALRQGVIDDIVDSDRFCDWVAEHLSAHYR